MIVKTDTDKHGTVRYYQNGKLRLLDGPAIEYANGDKRWYRDGKLHRVDGPAVERASGDKLWYQKGQLHRMDGPAIEYACGTKQWYRHGKLLDEFFPRSGYYSLANRQEAIERLNSKPRPYSYDLYLAWINERFPLCPGK